MGLGSSLAAGFTGFTFSVTAFPTKEAEYSVTVGMTSGASHTKLWGTSVLEWVAMPAAGLGSSVVAAAAAGAFCAEESLVVAAVASAVVVFLVEGELGTNAASYSLVQLLALIREGRERKRERL